MGLRSRVRALRARGAPLSNRFFENQPNEIYSHLREKVSKGRRFGPDKLQKEKKKGKEKERRRKKNPFSAFSCCLLQTFITPLDGFI